MDIRRYRCSKQTDAVRKINFIGQRGIASRFDESLGQPTPSASKGKTHYRIFYAFAPKFREYIGGRDSPYYPILGRKRTN